MGTEGFDWLKKGLKSRSESEDLDDAVLVAAIGWVFRFASIRFQWIFNESFGKKFVEKWIVRNIALDMCYKHSGIQKLLKSLFKDVVIENEFQKKLLAEIIPQGDIEVTFDDIGAFERMKETLKESVMLHLQRPELFTKCQLTNRRSALWDEYDGPSHYSGHGKG
ncbi:hypothetical protein CASFOL_032465 [Castilleja foliolosa]|uniref:Uncharacterized protein n=1 Tax=Castilleja foliolosa TaxID=1961234 RepID=A0ABD3C2U7_9LAMI